MNYKLKQAINNHIFENVNEFQIVNNTIEKFRNYIYDEKGEYLIGGEDVAKFIEDTNNLINHN